MAEKISRIFFCCLSFILMYFAVIFWGQKNYINTVCIFVLGLIANPFLTDIIEKKIGATGSNYWYAFRMLFNFLGILLAFIIALSLYDFTGMSSSDDELKEFRAILKISVYIVYLLVLFLWKNSDKYFKYLIFGLFYLLCVILSFCTDTLHGYIMEALNHLPDGNLDTMSYNMLINDCLVPIKEAILTYIIFDTIIENKKHIETNVENSIEKENKDTSNSNCYDVNVIDNNNGAGKNYQIRIAKK